MSAASTKSETLYLSASGIERLAGCEVRFVSNHADPDAGSETSVPLQLGTLLHRLVGAWLTKHAWREEWDLALEDLRKEDPSYLPDPDPQYQEMLPVPEFFERAAWIMGRYVEVYGEVSAFTPVALEMPFDLPIPGTDARVRGFMDGIVDLGSFGRSLREAPEPTGPARHAHELWLWETKSMGRWDRAQLYGAPKVPWSIVTPEESEDGYVEVVYKPKFTPAWDLQGGLYLWASRQFFDVKGVVFDAVNTYRYKGDAPAEKSFRRIPVPYDEALVARVVEDMQRVAVRAKQIIRKPSLAVRSVKRECQWCPFRGPCLRGEA